MAANETCILEGKHVAAITAFLDPLSRVSGQPHRLARNANQSFKGCQPLGMGFLLDPTEARSFITKDPHNNEVLSPFLNGEDLTSRWDFSASRWVIDFNDLPIEEAGLYSDLFAIISDKVRPERQRTNPDGSYILRRPLPQRWWQFADKRPALRRAIAPLTKVLVITIHSKVGLPVFISTGQVISHGIVAFATDQPAHLAMLSSSEHFLWWTTKAESTLETRLRYTPSDGFDTFPQPELTGPMEQSGQALDAYRTEVMAQRQIGLTDLYNLVHSESIADKDIVSLRDIHTGIDEAVQDAYALDEEREPAIRKHEAKVASAPLPSWREIELGHGFYETRQGIRFTITPQARMDVLDKLLALNHYRYEQEVKQGLHSGKVRGASNRKGVAGGSVGTAPVLDDGGLFAPEGTLF